MRKDTDMKVITLANMKGGVGKSSSATALSAILTERGYRTLFIDCDQQCNRLADELTG